MSEAIHLFHIKFPGSVNLHRRFRHCSHDAGTKLCRHKMYTVCNCSHDAGSMSVSSFFLAIFITVKMFRQTVIETLTVTCSHSAETVEFRYGFKLLRLASWFQTLTFSVTVSHFFHAGIV